ncbi:hypothetical protein AB205_0024880 [Aquarana catesbeiana]|uniref:Uncharacterized protein n=1 Tax=Aquarana catesbeiana TaxID=8400 RepID=A0A2G9S6V9_AQUCT|nr:hypothetical protein AB205_0024880 [Aquarana catesbeiana]
MAFCDVDCKKICKGFYTHEESEKRPKPKIPILHFKEAKPPFIICVKLVSEEIWNAEGCVPHCSVHGGSARRPGQEGATYTISYICGVCDDARAGGGCEPPLFCIYGDFVRRLEKEGVVVYNIAIYMIVL